MEVIMQLIQEKQEAIKNTAERYEAMRKEARSGNLYAMRMNLVDRKRKAEIALIEQEEVAFEANELLWQAENDPKIPEAVYDEIEAAAYAADKDLRDKINLFDAYEEALELLDKLSDNLQYIEAQED